MLFDSPLVPATLVSRYKRFLFDAVLEDGTAITGSCPNTGSMRGLTTPGSRIWLSQHESATRKHRYMLELVEADGTIVGINTSMPNKLVQEALGAAAIPSLAGYSTIKRERRYGKNSRIDFLLSANGRPDAYVEVKNVHFTRQKGLAEFPDTATKRGVKHLEELGDAAQAGYRAVMLYVIQRSDCDLFRICDDLDPAYSVAFQHAMRRGVEAYAMKCSVSAQEIAANEMVAIDDRHPAAL